jgi:hypothetical protein
MAYAWSGGFGNAHCSINEDQKDKMLVFVMNLEMQFCFLYQILQEIGKNKPSSILNNVFTKKIHFSNFLPTFLTKEKPKNMFIFYKK